MVYAMRIGLNPKLRRILPWFLAAILLYVLFSRYPLTDVLHAASHIDTGLFILFILGYFTYFTLTDCWSLQRNLADFGVSGSFVKITRLRLASNLIMVLNYGLGQGVLAYLVGRHYHVSFPRVSGILLLQLATDLYLMISISTVATLLTPVIVGDYNLVPFIRIVWAMASMVFLVIVLIPVRTGSSASTGGKSLENLFSVVREVRLPHLLMLALRRLPLHFATSTYLFFLAPAFGVQLPFMKVLAQLPLTVVIGAIPITPSGLGTVQITSIALFSDQLTGPAIDAGTTSAAEMIFAMSLCFTLALYVLKMVTALFCYRRAADLPTLENTDCEAHRGVGS